MTYKIGQRKLQRIRESYYVALPLSWVHHHQLHQSSKVLIYLDNGLKKLHIKPTQEDIK